MIPRSVGLFSLLCLSSGIQAQDAEEFSSLEFFPSPVMATDATYASPLAVSTDERQASDEPEPSPAELLAAIRQTIESISVIEARNGARAPAMGGELATLAALYRQSGDHPLAIAALERALGVVRVNHGLFSFEQVPLIEGVIESRIALGEYDEAAKLDTTVLELVGRNRGDSRIAATLTALADREMDTVERFIEHGAAPQFNFNMDPLAGPDLRAVEALLAGRQPVLMDESLGEEPVLTGRRAAVAALRSARRHYNQAIAATQIKSGADIEALFEVEQKVIQTLYLEVTSRELRPSGPGFLRADASAFRPGESVFRAHITNSRSHRRTAVDVADALLKLGDWQLMFSRNATALNTYQTAHDLLIREGVAMTTIDELLTPTVPVMLPSLDPLADAAAVPSSYRGFVDLSFVVTRYGRVKGDRVIGASSGTPSKVVKLAKQHASQARVRPRFAAGTPTRGDRVAVRYYYDY